MTSDPIYGEPARDVCHAFFEREGFSLTTEGNRHNGMMSWAGVCRHYLHSAEAGGRGGDISRYMPCVPGMEGEIEGIIREVKRNGGDLPDGSVRLRKAAEYAAYLRKLAAMPRIPFDKLPGWTRLFIARVNNDDLMTRMVLTRIWPVLCSLMGGYETLGRMGYNQVYPSVSSLLVGPSSCGKTTTSFVCDLILHNITERDHQHMADMRANSAERDAAGSGKKAKKTAKFVHTVQDLTLASLRQNLSVSGGERCLVRLDELDQARTLGGDIATFMGLLKRSDGATTEVTLRVADNAVSSDIKMSVNFEICGNTEAAYRMFRAPIKDGNSGELGRLLLCAIPYYSDYVLTPQLGPLPDAAETSEFFISKLSGLGYMERNPKIVSDIRDLEMELMRRCNADNSASMKTVIGRNLDFGYLIAHIAEILSGEYTDRERALAEFVVRNSLHSFRHTFAPLIDASMAQKKKKKESDRLTRKDLPDEEFSAQDLAARTGCTLLKAQQNCSMWVKQGFLELVKKGVYRKAQR